MVELNPDTGVGGKLMIEFENAVENSILVVDTEDGTAAIEIANNVDIGTDYAHPVFLRMVNDADQEVFIGLDLEAAAQVRNAIDVIIQQHQRYPNE